MNINNAGASHEFTFKPCAICGEPVNGKLWYAVIGNRPVHSACFQASKATGHSIKLLPK